MRAFLLGLVFLVLTGWDRALAAPADSPGDRRVSAQLDTARLAYRNGDFDFAILALEPAMRPEEFSQFSLAKRHEVSALYGEAAWVRSIFSKAHAGYRAATDTGLGSPDDWLFRMQSAARSDDAPDAYVSFRHLVTQSPEVFAHMASFAVVDLDAAFGGLSDAPAARLALASVLYRSGWADGDPRYDDSALWLHAAAAAVDAGSGEAANYAHRIRSPRALAALRADRRFDAIVQADPAAFDVRAAAEADLVRARDDAAQYPDSMALQFGIARALAALGRPQEALDVLNETLAKAEPGNHVVAYGDAPWVKVDALVLKAEVLSQLGRDEQAEALLEATAETCACRSLDVELARYLTELGRAQEAIPVVADRPREGLNAVDLMDLAEARACVYAASNQPAPLADQIAYLRSREAAKPEALFEALLCAGDDEPAAAQLVSMLRDPNQRLAGLDELLTFSGGHLRPGAAAQRHQVETIAARADVRAAVSGIGRLSSYDLPL